MTLRSGRYPGRCVGCPKLLDLVAEIAAFWATPFWFARKRRAAYRSTVADGTCQTPIFFGDSVRIIGRQALLFFLSAQPGMATLD
jgi:hypothetical protein